MALSGVRNLTVAGALVLASTVAAAAQETIAYPVDTVTLVTDSNPGGGTDVYFREMIKYLGPMMGVNFVVKNNSAGGGAAALAEAATAPADGSVLYGVTPSYIYMSLLTDLEKDRNDVEPVVNIFDDPVVLYVKADSPFTNLSDVIADAKANPGTQKWAAGSPTSLSRISLEAMKKSTGVDVTVVPHDSGSDTLLNVLNGTLQVGIGEAGETAEHVAAGNLRLIAVLRAAPMEALPGVETAESQGVPLVVTQFRGLTGPKGLPPDVIAAWNEAIPALLEVPEFKAWYDRVGMVASYMPHDQFVAFVDEFAGSQEDMLKALGAL